MRRRRAAPDARTEILARVHAALGDDGRAGSAGSGGPEPGRGYRARGDLEPGSDELIALFVERVTEYGAGVHRATDADEATRVLARLIAQAGMRTVVVPPWADATWVTAVAGAGAEVLTDSVTTPVDVVRLDEVDAVVTGARLAVAETGTLILDGAGDQGRRRITLIPDRHVCVVRADQVVQTVPEAIALLGRAPERPQTWISGPSATSDIELTRVEGVHGPRRLDVVLVG